MGVLKTAIKYAIPFFIGFYIGGCDREIVIERRYDLVPKNIESRSDPQTRLEGLERILEKYEGR